MLIRTLTGVGCVTAALLFAAPAHGQGMSGGTGSFSGGGSGGGGGGGSGGGSSGSGSSDSSGSNFAVTGQTLQTSIGSTPSTLNSFNNVGTGTSSNGAVSTSNPLAAYYYNPLAQGLITISSSGTATPSNTAFGAPLYGNLSSGSSSTGRSSNSAFGGSANSGSLGSFGGTSASSSNRTGSLSGTATISSSTTKAILFTGGGSYGPAIGRRGPVIGGPVRMAGIRPIALASRQSALQQVIANSSLIRTPGAVAVTTNGGTVLLTGQVASADEARIAESVLRTYPGVTTIQNNLTVGPPPGPAPIAPPP